MTQPNYVPITPSDQVRPVDRLRTPETWKAERPADHRGVSPAGGRQTGTPGPDQGYALALARRFEDRLVLVEGERAEDAIAGCLGVALRRAALFGRAPVAGDLEHAFTLWGFLDDPPSDLLAYRKPLFEAASHHYWSQRTIADKVPNETLRMTPPQVTAALLSWRGLIHDLT